MPGARMQNILEYCLSKLESKAAVIMFDEEVENFDSNARRPYYRMRGEKVTQEQAFDMIRRVDNFFLFEIEAIREHRDYIGCNGIIQADEGYLKRCIEAYGLNGGEELSKIKYRSLRSTAGMRHIALQGRIFR